MAGVTSLGCYPEWSGGSGMPSTGPHRGGRMPELHTPHRAGGSSMPSHFHGAGGAHHPAHGRPSYGGHSTLFSALACLALALTIIHIDAVVHAALSSYTQLLMLNVPYRWRGIFITRCWVWTSRRGTPPNAQWNSSRSSQRNSKPLRGTDGAWWKAPAAGASTAVALAAHQPRDAIRSPETST